MDLAQALKAIGAVPRQNVNQFHYKPAIDEAERFSEKNVAADSLGSIDLMNRLSQMGISPQVNIKEQMSYPGAGGIYNPDDNSIDIHALNTTFPERWKTLNHELGHFVDNNSINTPYNPSTQSAPVSEYAKKNSKEKYAEGFAKNVHDAQMPPILRNLRP